MNWHRKAMIQRMVAALPQSNAIYYALQRNFGNLRRGSIDPLGDFKAALSIVEWIESAGVGITGKRFLEVGTGRMINIPTALWLCGAGQVVTVDLNPYLEDVLIAESMQYVRQHKDAVRQLFGTRAETPAFQTRYAQLLEHVGDTVKLLDLMNVEYLGRTDAAHLSFNPGSFDFHISHAVFEHIPADSLELILAEARRLLARGGLLLHIIDPSDHFSHDDSSITAANFLKFDERQWRRLAGNKFMYHNRLRAFEFIELFKRCGVRVLRQAQTIDELSLLQMRNGFPLAKQFKHIPPEDLAVRSLILLGSFD
jgi:SAM-dependent methyltransferase